MHAALWSASFQPVYSILRVLSIQANIEVTCPIYIALTKVHCLSSFLNGWLKFSYFSSRKTQVFFIFSVLLCQTYLFSYNKYQQDALFLSQFISIIRLTAHHQAVFLCIYRQVSPDDEQQTCSKYVEVKNRNKLRVK